MTNHFADNLLEAIDHKGAPICVGIDPVLEKLPAEVLNNAGIDGSSAKALWVEIAGSRAAEAFIAYGKAVIEAVAPMAAAVKINIAFFERFHLEGLRAYYELVRVAREAGQIVIGDVKRADIGHTSAAYADAFLTDGGDENPAADAITVNPYFGIDGVRPFIDVAKETGRGVFVLVQTSNESAAEIQNLRLSDGAMVSERVATLVQQWGSGAVGARGYSCVGAVVSPRDLAATDRLRELMPNCLFLVPGFGAQGRTPEEVFRCFKRDGTGALVTASRSVGFAFAEPKYANAFGKDWKRCIAEACKDFHSAIRGALRGR